ncbi:MAG: DUF1566 domain-containing protein [Bdellovibrionaceae bacterium]|nr:DUF1566 domain-containing protein [Pseudobdellovibrionaceae bacterium]
MNKRHLGFAILLISFMMMNVAAAQTQGISFQAVLQAPGGTYPTETNLEVKLLVLTPGPAGNRCVLRSETHTGVSLTDGYLNLVLSGLPSSINPADPLNPSTVLSLEEALDNTVTRTGLVCVDQDNAVVASGQSYVPAAGDRRILRLVVDLNQTGHSTDVIVADFNLRSVPYAMNAQTLNGKDPSAFIQAKPATKVTQAHLDQFFATITTASGNSIRWNGTSFVAFDPSSGANLTAGSVPSSALTSVDWGKLVNVPAGVTQLAGLSCAAGKILKRGASAWVCGDETVPTEADPTVKTYAKNDPGAGLEVSANALRVKFSTSSVAGSAVQANDPRLSDARAPTTHTHNYESISSSVNGYMRYAPNGVNCSNGQTLKWDGSKWICGVDNVGGGGGGGGPETDPTVAAFARNNPGIGLGVDVSDVLFVQYGNTSTTAARGDDPRLSDTRDPKAHVHSVADINSAASAYFTYRPSNASCSDGNVLKWSSAGGGRWECGTDLEGSGSPPEGPVLTWPAATSGQFMKFSGGNWIGQTFAESDVPGLTAKLGTFTSDISSLQASVSDLESEVAGQQVVKYSQLPGSACAAHQTLAFSSPSNAWYCGDIDYSATRLPAADGSAGGAAGIVTAVAQSFAGVKTFVNKVFFGNDIEVTNNASVGFDLTVGQDVNVGRGVNVVGLASVGGLKIGLGSGITCGPSTAGVLRYDDSEGAIVFCNGANWMPIGGDGDGGSPGGGDPGGGGPDLGSGNVCSLFPPLGMPCPDGTFYSGVFRYDFRDHKVTTVAPPGCILVDPADPEDSPTIECPSDAIVDSQLGPWAKETVTGSCGATGDRDGLANRGALEEGDCAEILGAPAFCMGVQSEDGDDSFYLPSIDELKYLYDHRAEIGGFTNGIYWSSTQNGATAQAKVVDFSTGQVTTRNMTQNALVRCMRQHAQ